jgi:hypothetical protein
LPYLTVSFPRQNRQPKPREKAARAGLLYHLERRSHRRLQDARWSDSLAINMSFTISLMILSNRFEDNDLVGYSKPACLAVLLLLNTSITSFFVQDFLKVIGDTIM